MLKRLITRYKNSEFLVNITKLGSATTIAQFISVGTAPILYRIYDKSHYGTLGLYMAITGVIGVFSTLQYVQTILLEKEDEDAINAMWLNRTINTGFALLTLVVILILFPFIIDWVNNPSLNKWLWFVPVSIFFAGQNQIFRVWANRKKEYNLLTFNMVFMAILTPLISIGLGYALQNETGLFIGLIVGQSLPTLILFLGLRKKYELGFGAASFQKMKNLAIANKQFPIYSLPSEFVNRFTNQLPVFMLNSFVGPAAVGVYNLAIRMLGLPIQFIGGAISTVFQQRATEDYNNTGSCRPIFLKTLKTLSLIAVVPTLVVLLFGPDMFALVFGEKWREAGIYAQILIFLHSLKLIISPLSYIFFIARKQKVELYFAVFLACSSLILYLYSRNLGVYQILFFHTLIFSLSYLFTLYLSYSYANYKL